MKKKLNEYLHRGVRKLKHRKGFGVHSPFAFVKKEAENFGYSCITGERQYYQENYPDVVIEKSGIDELILMMTGGNR